MSGKIYSIQYLRGIAALAVVAWHSLEMIPGFQREVPTPIGAAGVDLFFVVSGFIMVFVTETREQRPSAFALSRILRVVPLYWLFTAGAALVLAAVPFLYHSNELSIRHVLLSLAFVPHTIASAPGDIQPLVKVGWTLNLEMFFYALFTISMWISSKHRVLIATVALVALATSSHVFHFATTRYDAWPDTSAWFFAKFYTQDVILDFVAGMNFATLYFRGPALKAPSSLLIGCVVISVLWFQFGPSAVPVSRFLYWGVPASILVATALAWEKSGRVGQIGWLTLLGDSSYSLYLSHMVPVAILRWVWNHFSLPTHGLLLACIFCLLGIASALATGITVYQLVEKPMLSWGHRLRDRFTPPSGALARQ